MLQDLPLLAGLMIVGAFLLFFTTVAWGRVWCGFACPQSVWTWLFIRIEQVTEGDAGKRARYAGQPLKGGRLIRRISKHLLWILLSLLTATTFTGYFVPVREIINEALQLGFSSAPACWVLIMTALTYVNAGLVREKICLHACPYARFQSVMFDQHTRTVSYDRMRGEPRASARSNPTDSGDCVDCSICVQVCPTGIDIRNGLQAACIDCGACIDACDKVMSKLNRPGGLIRFASETQLKQGSSRFLRPRLVGYAAATACALAVVLYGFSNTTDLVVDIQRDRGTLFTHMEGGGVCNDYLVKVEAASDNTRVVEVSLLEGNLYELSGPSLVHLIESNASWLPYRACTRDPQGARESLNFRFIWPQGSALKATTFISGSI